MAYGMMRHALQEQALKSGYMILDVDSARYDVLNNGTNFDGFAVVDLIEEKLIGIETDLGEVADLLGCICLYSTEERLQIINRRRELAMNKTVVDKKPETAIASLQDINCDLRQFGQRVVLKRAPYQKVSRYVLETIEGEPLKNFSTLDDVVDYFDKHEHNHDEKLQPTKCSEETDYKESSKI